MSERRTTARRTSEQGQALVEFAITVPLMVMIILFAIWFYELTHIKLKVQEAARFAAWETTAFPLHNYNAGSGSTLPIPALNLPQVNLGSLGINVPGGMGGMANAQLNQALQGQLGKLIPFGGFGLSAQAVAAVSVETMARYADMNSATMIPSATSMLSASWTPPLVFAVDQMEEPVYGGPLVNLLVGLGGALFDIISSLFVTDQNWVAQTLLKSGKDMGGAQATRTFGSPEWGFNRRGYIQSYVAVAVTNEWFGSGVGRMIMPNATVTLRESHGVLADSWRLNNGGASYGIPTRPGYVPQSPLWKQVDRMYLQNGRTRGVFKATALMPFLGFMRAALSAVAFAGTAPKEGDMSQTSVVSRSYTTAATGKAPIIQDAPFSWLYDTAPMRGDYKKTLDQRGAYFMGCKEAMQLGCTDSLSQENPLGDYIVRE